MFTIVGGFVQIDWFLPPVHFSDDHQPENVFQRTLEIIKRLSYSFQTTSLLCFRRNVEISLSDLAL